MSTSQSPATNFRDFEPAMMRNENVVCSEKIVDVNNKQMIVRVSPKGLSYPSSSVSSAKVSFCGNHVQLLIQNHENFKRSGEPGRVMSYVNGSWVDYPMDVVELVKSCFAEGRPVTEVNIRGTTCLIDFYRMLEIDFCSGFEKSVAWIDVNGKCFFPRVFVNSTEPIGNHVSNNNNNNNNGDDEATVYRECPKIEIEVRICENSKASGNLDLKEVDSCKRARDNEEFEVEQARSGKSEGSSSNFRVKRRQIAASEMDMPRWPKTRLMKKEEKGYIIVNNLFSSGFGIMEPGATITRIHQCTRTGPIHKARYEVFLKQMEIVKKARGESNMVFAWHGTSAKGVQSILTHGFGLSNVAQGSQAHGNGVHLSSLKFPCDSALMSEVDVNGEKHVILCRVILGKCEKVEAGSQQRFPSSVDFDSGADDLENPRWYVVWCTNMNTHVLPEVVVSYKPANNAQGQFTGDSFVNSVPTSSSPSIANLISRLRRSLPPPKVQELLNLYSSFKDGEVGKEIFLKQLRSVVGDAMLRSIIHGMHG